jgi:hypothetical protein
MASTSGTPSPLVQRRRPPSWPPENGYIYDEFLYTMPPLDASSDAVFSWIKSWSKKVYVEHDLEHPQDPREPPRYQPRAPFALTGEDIRKTTKGGLQLHLLIHYPKEIAGLLATDIERAKWIEREVC